MPSIFAAHIASRFDKLHSVSVLASKLHVEGEVIK
jgi:hypothetical protein